MKLMTMTGAGALAALVVLAVPLAAQDARMGARREREVLRGSVTDERGSPLAGALVRATRAPDRLTFDDTTGSAGEYHIVVPEGTGDYLLHVSRDGYRAVRKRIVETAEQSLFVNDVILLPLVTRMATVRVEARRVVPRRNDNAASDIGAAEQTADNLAGMVLPELRGDLQATAATIPGVMQTPDGISVLGLGPEQNRVTLGGLSFDGATIPRSLGTVTRVATTAYDPAIGWGGGAQVAVDVLGGGRFSFRNAHLTLDAPMLQAHGAVPGGLSRSYTGFTAGIGGGGPLDKRDRHFYAIGVEGRRRSEPTWSLANATPAALEAEDIAPDSARRLVQLLPSLGIPLGTGPGAGLEERATLYGRIDRSAVRPGTSEPARQTWGVAGYVDVARESPASFANSGLRATPSTLRRSRRATGTVQAMHSAYFREAWLSETRSAWSVVDGQTTPFSSLPAGTVDVSSTLADETVQASQLYFGGGAVQASHSRRWTWETLHETQRHVSRGAAHRVKLTAASRLDRYARSASGSSVLVGYSSLADLAANRPSYLSRSAGLPASTAGAWNGFVSAGALWRVNRNLRLIYGVRAEGNVFTNAPEYDPRVHVAFGDHVGGAPNTLHASPRLGFTWTFRDAGGAGIRVTPLGTLSARRRHTIRGGIGEFRSMLPPDLLARAMVANGSAGGASHLFCVGSAVPAIDWATWEQDPSAVPSSCADGTPTMADDAPAVEVFAHGFTAPRSWRGNLAYASQVGFLNFSVEALHSLNLDQPSQVDLNFDATPEFTLADDARPVFVSRSSIVPSSGLAASGTARRVPDFGAVIERRSDARSVSRQLTFVLSPDIGRIANWYSSVAYTLGSMRARERGFDATTYGDPSDWSWARGPRDARHQFTLIAGAHGENVGFSLVGRARSGFPFTPMVSRDINGDGLANDAAFIFAPGHAGEPAVERGLATLRDAADDRIRRCLNAQAGGLAARRSCEGPWTGSLDGYLSVNTRLLPARRSLRFGLSFSNLLGAFDRMLHGTAVRGWGETQSPDPVLYSVHGFDPVASRYRYEVNPRFGSVWRGTGINRRPFRVTLEVAMDLGQPLVEQQVHRFLRPGRGGYPGTRLTEDALRERYWRTVPDPYAGILQEADSLLLSRAQVTALHAAQEEYRAGADGIWTPLVGYLARLDDDFDSAEALRRQEATTQAALEFAQRHVQRVLPTILDPIQLRLLPDPADSYYRARPGTQGGRRFRL